MRYEAEPILGHEQNHWQVVEQTCGMDVPRCETVSRVWAEKIAGLLNESALSEICDKEGE
jgi:hypothetical protein